MNRSTKRVILANGSRLLREVFQHVINKTDHLKVVQEITNLEELPSAIERCSPEWVIISVPFTRGAQGWINTCIAEYLAVRFIVLAPDNSSIKMKWQSSYEADLTNLSLRDFIQILDKDPQRT